jgi:2-dehydropantoate 2-reductase
MGAIFGGALSRAGAEVVFFDSRSEVVDAINRDGLRVSGIMGEFSLRCAAIIEPSDLGNFDMALVLVNAGATATVASVAERCLGPNGFALTLQNGIGNWEALAGRLGERRVLAGSTFNSGAGLGPGMSHHSDLGTSWLGELDGTVSERAQAVAALFRTGGLPTEAVDNAVAVIWSKFILNCAINPVAAATGLRPGEIARDSHAAALVDGILDEALAVVEAEGITLPEPDPRGHIRDHCWQRFNKPSMLQHIESGRETEIDALNGALVEQARHHGIPTPINEAMVRVIKGREAAARRAHYVSAETAEGPQYPDELRNGRWGVRG